MNFKGKTGESVKDHSEALYSGSEVDGQLMENWENFCTDGETAAETAKLPDLCFLVDDEDGHQGRETAATGQWSGNSVPQDLVRKENDGHGGETGTTQWSGPRRLLNNEDGSMILNNETLALLELITEPLVIVSIVGLYRTGKSYLMNRLAGSPTGFDLGGTIQAQTKGIWIWCVLHPNKPDHRILLMDTEGLGDVEKGDTQNDTMLFLLAALLSCTLVYNSKGTIDNDAIEKLHFVTDLADKIKIEKKQGTAGDGCRLREFFPTFVWVVRDFHLKLEINGQPVTADEYLKIALTTKPGTGKKISAYNLPRESIKGFFPRHKCFVFPTPIDSSLMSILETLPTESLSPAFLRRSEEFCQYIYKESEAKMIKGAVLNGQRFSIMAKKYTEKLLKGGIPCIESTYVATARAVNAAAFTECVKRYKTAMSTLPLPTVDEETLRAHDQQCSAAVTEYFYSTVMAIYENDQQTLVKDLSDVIAEKYKEISEFNRVESSKKCHLEMEKLFMPIQAKITIGMYYRTGGYSEFQTDTGAAYRDYKDIQGKGVQAVTVENEYLTKYSEFARVIMMADNALSEKEKQHEEQRMQHLVLQRAIEALTAAVASAEQHREHDRKFYKELEASTKAKFEEQARQHKEQMDSLAKSQTSVPQTRCVIM